MLDLLYLYDQDSRLTHIYKNNRQQLLVFGMDGKFKYQIGDQGKGPGEFLEINDFIIDKNNIELLDFKKILTYSLSLANI